VKEGVSVGWGLTRKEREERERGMTVMFC